MSTRTKKVDELALIDKVRKGGVPAKMLDLKPHSIFLPLTSEWHIDDGYDVRFEPVEELTQFDSNTKWSLWDRVRGISEPRTPILCEFCEHPTWRVRKQIRRRFLGINEKNYEKIETVNANFGTYCPNCGHKVAYSMNDFPDWAIGQ